MKDHSYTLADFVGGELAHDWNENRDRLQNFLTCLGVTGDEHHEAIYLFPASVPDVRDAVAHLRHVIPDDENWVFFTSFPSGKGAIAAAPVSDRYLFKNHEAMLSVFFVDVHSRLLAWWLTSAWRSQQLARATWALGDEMQIIPAAACARSLLETAGSLWVQARRLQIAWVKIKEEHAKTGAQFNETYEIRTELWKTMWGAKFDERVPQLKADFGKIPSPNVMTLIDKLAKACKAPVHEYYNWLCNAVHPSVGGLLSFASPMLVHDIKTIARQPLAAFPLSIRNEESGKHSVESTIESTVIEASVLSLDVIVKTLDESLRFIDDVALTTRAGKISPFRYWRQLKEKPGKVPCPCRSGYLGEHCKHNWNGPVQPITDRFDRVPGVPNK